MKFDDIESAFFFVNFAPQGEHIAVINRVTGEVFQASSLAGYNELPEDVDLNDDYVLLPHKNDLDLGKSLVMEFVRTKCPEETNRIQGIFSRRGAYGRYKDFLAEKELLEVWYAFENERTRDALLKWCRGNGIVIDG